MTTKELIERDRALALTFEADHARLPGGWEFDFMYPGYFTYVREPSGTRVVLAPDFNAPGVVDVQVCDADGVGVELDAVRPVPYAHPLTAGFLLGVAQQAVAAVDAELRR